MLRKVAKVLRKLMFKGLLLRKVTSHCPGTETPQNSTDPHARLRTLRGLIFRSKPPHNNQNIMRTLHWSRTAVLLPKMYGYSVFYDSKVYVRLTHRRLREWLLKYAANGSIATRIGPEVLELRLPEFSASAARRWLSAHSKFDPTVCELHARDRRHLLTRHAH